MDPVDALHRFGGIATFAALTGLCDRMDLDVALLTGAIVRDARGRYALPTADEALRAANALTGVVSHLSAALHWGWEVKTVPDQPHITVPRSRNLTAQQRTNSTVHWAALSPEDVQRRVTSRERTLTDCLRRLPFDEGLCVADSALRHLALTPGRLTELTRSLSGPGSGTARRVARFADGRAANAFESALRAIALDVPDLQLVPQVEITAPGFYARPDLVDQAKRIVVEAESQTWHNANRAQLRRDCRRYTGLVVRGWTVVRFAWEDVMGDPAYVRDELLALARLTKERAQPHSRRRRAA